tara:strand:- start:545 stop:670 length:126 start_codon:yes stop_codon:yes gene_type:complete
MPEIVEILDKYNVDDFDDVLIKIIQTFVEQREIRTEEKNDD